LALSFVFFFFFFILLLSFLRLMADDGPETFPPPLVTGVHSFNALQLNVEVPGFVTKKSCFSPQIPKFALETSQLAPIVDVDQAQGGTAEPEV
jgi:hypothetical protein